MLRKTREFLRSTRFALMSASVPVVALCGTVPAFAAGSVSDAVTAGLGLFSATIDTLLTNPILLAILGASLVPLGFKIFKAAKNTVK